MTIFKLFFEGVLSFVELIGFIISFAQISGR